MTRNTPKDPAVLHPWLLTLFPVLFLYARNLGELDFGDVVRPLIAALGLTGLLYMALLYPVKSRLRRGLMASCLVALIYAYSNIASAVGSVLPLPADRWTGGYYLVWCIGAAVALVVISRLDRSLIYWTKILNVIALCLVLLNLLTILAAVPRKIALRSGALTIPEPWQGPEAVDTERPNIFILIFDQHVGAPVLERYGYDAGDFFSALRTRGFRVADNSVANYWMTPYAMAGLFNYTYLDFIKEQIPPGYRGHQPALTLTADNRVFRFLKEAGYTTAQCHTDFLYPYEHIDIVDRRINPVPWYTSALSLEVFGNTPFYGIAAKALQTPSGPGGPDIRVPLLRRAILGAFDETRKMAHHDGPFILFTHFLSPHPPYVFDEQGRVPGPDSTFYDVPVRFCAEDQKHELRLYLAEMAWLHQRIIEMVDYILAHSPRPPVIVLQGDHGNRLHVADLENGSLTPEAALEMYSILNALYLPGIDADALPDTLSPVNTFRVIFDGYFGTRLGLLPDRSFYKGQSPYEFRDVTDLTTQYLKDKTAQPSR